MITSKYLQAHHEQSKADQQPLQQQLQQLQQQQQQPFQQQHQHDYKPQYKKKGSAATSPSLSFSLDSLNDFQDMTVSSDWDLSSNCSEISELLEDVDCTDPSDWFLDEVFILIYYIIFDIIFYN